MDDIYIDDNRNANKRKTRRSDRIRAKNKNKKKQNLKIFHLIDLSNENEMDIDIDDDDDDDDDVELVQDESKIELKNELMTIEDDDGIIDIDDIEINLVGIAIGKHQDFWSCDNEYDRPRIIMNKHREEIVLNLKSIHLDKVNVSIKKQEIESIYLPEDPSFFNLSELSESIID